jgi:prophage tail gpP-like protein
MSDVVLRIDDGKFGGWKNVSLMRGIEQATGAFRIEVTERYPGQPDRWPIRKGMACTLELDGAPAITGYIDAVPRRFDHESSGITVSGRDRAADIVDSSAVIPGTQHGTGDFGPLSLPALCAQLCKPHGIQVRTAPGLDVSAPFAKLSIEPGETVWDCMERYARQRGVMIMSDALGGLLITRAGTELHPQPLVEGENILSAELDDDDSERSHQYVVLGQDEPTSNWNGKAALQPKGTAIDPAIRKNRIRLLIAESLGNGITLGDRATWERDVRRGRGKSLVVTVQGFSAQGRLWEPNMRVQARIPRLDIQDTFLIKSTNQSKSDDGTITEMTLVPPSVYDLLAQAEESSDAGAAW